MFGLIFNNRATVILFVLLIGSFLVSSDEINAANISDAHIQFAYIKSVPFVKETTPEATLPNLPESERSRYVSVAVSFDHPDARQINVDPGVNARLILAEPSEYDGFSFILSGTIVSIQHVQNLLPYDWPSAYVITIDDGTAWIPVLYRGDVKALPIGEVVLVEGVFVSAGLAIHADAVYQTVATSNWYDNLPNEMVIVAVILILAGVLAVIVILFRWLSAPIAAFMIILISLTGCNLQIETIIQPNGSVSTSARMSESEENIEFFRKIPGMRRYIASWQTSLRDEGAEIENWVEGKNEFFHIQNFYPDLAQYSALGEDADTDTWVYATSYQSGNSQCFRYLAEVDPQKLYLSQPNIDATAMREINKYIDQMKFSYAVTLPGQITFSNANLVVSNRLEWQLDMKRTNQLVAESCLHFPPVEIIDWRWGWMMIGGLGLVDLGLWIIALRGSRSNFSLEKIFLKGRK